MLRHGLILSGLLLPGVLVLGPTPCAAQNQPAASIHLHYETYAASLNVAEVAAGFSLGTWTYQMQLSYHTTGVVGFFYGGHEDDTVYGSWDGKAAVPTRFLGQGYWHSIQRQAELVYQHGEPVVRQLVPADDDREPVPDALRAHTIDTLSALLQLIHVVASTGRCETMVHTYDGRRALEIQAHTVGSEMLQRTDRSSFTGNALRCDFEGRMLAGFKRDEDSARQHRPMHGSAWLAPLSPGGMAVPVRMSFETQWFGDATMYLTDAGQGADAKIAQGK